MTLVQLCLAGRKTPEKCGFYGARARLCTWEIGEPPEFAPDEKTECRKFFPLETAMKVSLLRKARRFAYFAIPNFFTS
jgi:hypothetical protein